LYDLNWPKGNLTISADWDADARDHGAPALSHFLWVTHRFLLFDLLDDLGLVTPEIGLYWHSGG
jgi:hypothetical protein